MVGDMYRQHRCNMTSFSVWSFDDSHLVGSKVCDSYLMDFITATFTGKNIELHIA